MSSVTRAEQQVLAAVEVVLARIEQPGSMPSCHWTVLAAHRREWPMLWKAIDGLQQRHGELMIARSATRDVQEGGPAREPAEPRVDHERRRRKIDAAIVGETTPADLTPERADELLERAWGIIANAGGWREGDQATPGWRGAAERWRDEVMPTLGARAAARAKTEALETLREAAREAYASSDPRKVHDAVRVLFGDGSEYAF